MTLCYVDLIGWLQKKMFFLFLEKANRSIYENFFLK